jgi:hypothetical protein
MVLRALAFVAGVAGAAAPERFIDAVNRQVLAGYENPEALEPEAWYVDLIRAKFALVAVAALVAPFLPTPSEAEPAGTDEGPVVDVIESDAGE